MNWAQLAQRQPVTDVGQISKEERKHLDKLVQKGLLLKGENVSYPKPKPFWVSPYYLGTLPGPLNKR